MWHQGFSVAASGNGAKPRTGAGAWRGLWFAVPLLAAGLFLVRRGRSEPAGLVRQTSGHSATPAHFEGLEPGRGRLAASPLDIPWLGWRDVAWRTVREATQDRLTVVAGAVTYCTLLAIFPALGVFVSLYGLIADVGAVQAQLNTMARVFPPAALNLLGEQMVRLATGKTSGLSLAFAVSLLLSIWSASAGIRSLFDGLNTAYDEVERRPLLRRTAVIYGFTAAFIVFLTVISAILVAAPLALAALSIRDDLFTALRWPLVLIVATGAFMAVYRFGPSRAPARWRWLAPGAIFAAMAWLGGSAGFSWYLNNVAKLDATYGSLGAVIGFLLWVWFSAMMVLLGAELNAEIEHQTARDSTTGPPEPMGQRNAVMADTVGPRFVGVRETLRGLRGRIPSRIRPRARPNAPPGPQRSKA